LRQRLTVGLEDSTAPYKPRNFKLDGAVIGGGALLPVRILKRIVRAG